MTKNQTTQNQNVRQKRQKTPKIGLKKLPFPFRVIRVFSGLKKS
jgi:hypothetical protein